MIQLTCHIFPSLPCSVLCCLLGARHNNRHNSSLISLLMQYLSRFYRPPTTHLIPPPHNRPRQSLLYTMTVQYFRRLNPASRFFALCSRLWNSPMKRGKQVPTSRTHPFCRAPVPFQASLLKLVPPLVRSPTNLDFPFLLPLLPFSGKSAARLYGALRSWIGSHPSGRSHSL